MLMNPSASLASPSVSASLSSHTFSCHPSVPLIVHLFFSIFACRSLPLSSQSIFSCLSALRLRESGTTGGGDSAPTMGLFTKCALFCVLEKERTGKGRRRRVCSSPKSCFSAALKAAEMHFIIIQRGKKSQRSQPLFTPHVFGIISADCCAVYVAARFQEIILEIKECG